MVDFLFALVELFCYLLQFRSYEAICGRQSVVIVVADDGAMVRHGIVGFSVSLDTL